MMWIKELLCKKRYLKFRTKCAIMIAHTHTYVARCGHLMKFYGYHKIVKFAKQTISFMSIPVRVYACVCPCGRTKCQFSDDFISFSLFCYDQVCVIIDRNSKSFPKQLVGHFNNLLIYALRLWILNSHELFWTINSRRRSQQIVMAEWQRNDWT